MSDAHVHMRTRWFKNFPSFLRVKITLWLNQLFNPWWCLLFVDRYIFLRARLQGARDLLSGEVTLTWVCLSFLTLPHLIRASGSSVWAIFRPEGRGYCLLAPCCQHSWDSGSAKFVLCEFINISGSSLFKYCSTVCGGIIYRTLLNGAVLSDTSVTILCVNSKHGSCYSTSLCYRKQDRWPWSGPDRFKF